MNKIHIILIIIASLPLRIFSQGCMDAGNSEGVKVAGFIQPQFEMKQTDEKWINSFTFERARFGFLGNIPYDVSYYVMVESSAFKSGNPFLLDAFISYNRYKKWARISVGAFKNPISLEENTACHGLYTVKRSKVVTELVNPDRDLGVMVSGGTDSTFIRYYLAVQNGTGLGKFDDSGAKDYAARIVFQPFSFLHFGGSYRYGKHESPLVGEPEESKLRIGGELEVKYRDFLMQGEYMYAEDQGTYTTGGGCGGTGTVVKGNVIRDGFFVQAMYMTQWRVQPVYKYEYFNPNKLAEKDAITTHTIGINYFLNDWTRIQANYRMMGEEGNSINNDEFYLQFQVRF